MKNKKIITYIAFMVIGSLFGRRLYKFIGCPNGTCPISSSVYRSMAYGGFAGLLTAFVATGE